MNFFIIENIHFFQSSYHVDIYIYIYNDKFGTYVQNNDL
jgi:hypothetical protein